MSQSCNRINLPIAWYRDVDYLMWFKEVLDQLLSDKSNIKERFIDEQGNVMMNFLHKDYDDAISRYTSYHDWKNYDHLRVKFLDEVTGAIVKRPVVVENSEPLTPDYGKLVLNLSEWKKVSIYSSKARKVIYSYTHKNFIQQVKLIYPRLSIRNITLLSFIHWVQRSTSGSNWSPAGSYPGLEDIPKEVGIVECFCSIMNNQDLIHGKKVTDYRLCLQYEDIRRLTGDESFVGTWPSGVDTAMNLLKDRTSFILLVNPPYSEPEIWRTFQAIGDIYERYSDKDITVWMTLPDWNDLYEDQDLVNLLSPASIMINEPKTGDKVYNYSMFSGPRHRKFSYRRIVIAIPDRH